MAARSVDSVDQKDSSSALMPDVSIEKLHYDRYLNTLNTSHKSHTEYLKTRLISTRSLFANIHAPSLVLSCLTRDAYLLYLIRTGCVQPHHVVAI